MIDAKFTQGEWSIVEGDEYIEIAAIANNFKVCNMDSRCDNSIHDANLIAAAPEMYRMLQNRLNYAYESWFESWLYKELPSGDCEEVHGKWIASSEHLDFLDEWESVYVLLAKARGE